MKPRCSKSPKTARRFQAVLHTQALQVADAEELLPAFLAGLSNEELYRLNSADAGMGMIYLAVLVRDLTALYNARAAAAGGGMCREPLLSTSLPKWVNALSTQLCIEEMVRAGAAARTVGPRTCDVFNDDDSCPAVMVSLKHDGRGLSETAARLLRTSQAWVLRTWSEQIPAHVSLQ